MNSKDKIDYWWKIIFLAIFGLAMGAAAFYTIFAYPFSLLTVIYFLGTGAGSAFSLWAAVKLFKDYKKLKAEENRQ